ncbi:target of Nesh-SH3 isoform X7 [Pelodiscus sinensis]|uniref:target of Nesh-SH3 isoform X7 n=1 Tax=Pelodiscus sinensis TaxID=13735 RepID=UPI003F6D30B4
MISRLVFLLFCGHIALNLGNAQKLPRGQNLKVQINTTDDTICMKYLRLIPNTKLHGFILGYGSSFFSNQYIPLPSEGKSYVTEVDAEPRYLITVRAAPVRNHRKTCSGKTKTQKPLQLVVGTLTPNSVFLSWGILVNPQHDWTATSSCASDRFYTVRYREKDKNKKWGFQLCPTTETVVDNLKPNTLYEFGVKDNTEDGIWSKIFNHKTILSNKNKGNGHLQNTYKFIPNSQTQFIPGDGTKRVPITRIKQVIQNITHRILPKATDRPSLAGAILVHLIIPGLNETPPKFPKTLGMFETPKKKLIMNETQMWPAESKTPKVQEISPQSFPATIESFQESIKPTVPAASEKSDTSSDYNESELESTKPNIAPTPELSLNTLAHSETESGLEETNSTPKPELAQTQNILASNEMQIISSGFKISDAPKIRQTKPATTKPALKSSFPFMETPETVMVSDETQIVSSRPKPSDIPEKLPTKSVTIQTTMKTVTPEASKAEAVSYDFPPVATTPQTAEISEIFDLDSVTNSADLETSEPLISRIPHLLGTMALDDIQPVVSSPTTSDEPDITDTRPAATSEPTVESFSPKTSSALEWPRETLAPNEIPLIPSKLKPYPLPEVQHVKPAQKPLLLGQSTPKASKTIEWSKTTLAPWETKFVTSTPKPSARPKMPQSKPAEKSIHLESNTPKFSIPLELPRTTLAPSKTKLIPSKPKVSLHPEEPKSKPAATRKPIAVPVTSKISSVTATTETLEHPKSTMVSYEPQHIPSKPKASASAIPEMPHSKPAKSPITPEATHKISSNDLEWPRATLESSEIHFTSLKPKSSAEPKMPQYKPAPTETQFIPSKPNTSPEPELLHSKPAPKETRRVPLKPKPSPKPHVPQTKPALESTTFRTEQPKTPLAPKEVRRVPSKPKISPSPDVPQAKPAPKETQRVPSKPKTSPIPDTPPTKAAAKEIRRITSRPKTLASPEVPPTKPVPKEIQRIPSKLKTSASPDVPHTKPAGIIPSIQEPVTATAPYSLERAKATLAPKEIRLIPSKPKASVRPEAPQTKPVPNETYPISFKPQTALTTENPQLKTVSYVVRTETIKPKISKPFGKTEATLAPHKVHLTPARPKISDKPQTRPVLNKTTPGPGRTKTAGVVRWGGTPTEVVRDSTKFLMGSNVSLESNVTRKKIDSVAIPPDSRHPPVAPARPTQVRRKPLPPNTVTGKPGSPGISSTSRASASSTTSAVRPTGPTKSLKTEKPRKKPTVSASPEEPVNTTVFSSSPTSETDVQGQPRFKAPYVVYMPKGDNEPCSITSTLEHFPEEEASNKEDATNPPQNPPSNLTVVTVEGCPSFVVLNWTKPENDTVTEYKVVSTENGAPTGKEMSILTTNQTHSTVENLKPNTSYEFQVKAINPSGEGPPSDKVQFDTESADPRVSEPISMGKDAIWTEIPFNSNAYSECKGKQYVKRTWYKKFVGVQLCNSLRYKIYLSDSLTGKFYSIGDQRGHGEDHCQFVDSFLDGRTGQQVSSDQLPMEDGFFRAVRQEPVKFGKIGGSTHINYVHWYECGTSIPGKW